MMTTNTREMSKQDLFINYHSIMEDIDKSYKEIRKSMISLEFRLKNDIDKNNIVLRYDSNVYIFDMFVDVYLEEISKLKECIGNPSLFNSYLWSYTADHMLMLLVRYAYELNSLFELRRNRYSNNVNYKIITIMSEPSKNDIRDSELDILAKDLLLPNTIFGNEDKLSCCDVLYFNLCIYNAEKKSIVIPYSNTNCGVNNVTEELLSAYGYKDIIDKNLSIEERFNKTMQILRTHYGF